MITDRESSEAVKDMMMLGVDCNTYVYFAQLVNGIDLGAAKGDPVCIQARDAIIKVGKLVRASTTAGE